MHIPVLLHEVIEILDPKPGEFFIDGTVGGGSHAELIIQKIGPRGLFLGVDWDREAVTRTQLRIKNYELRKKIIFHDSYANLPEILLQEKFPKADGLLLDLGLSSDQLESSGRGFSFQKDEPLDMRYSQTLKNSAAEILNRSSLKELTDVLWRYGEEKAARRLAQRIIEVRRRHPFKTTKDLVAVVEEVLSRRGRLHPATKVFQALRIAVNHELENLSRLLQSIPKMVKPNGRVAIISFHSLEDRLVKNSFKSFSAQGKAKILTSKPIIASKIEAQINPKSRSAKLRAIKLM